MTIRSEFKVTAWNETELEGGSRLMRVAARFETSGQLSGSLDVNYLMHYISRDEQDLHDSLAWYTGFLAFEGSLDGKKGGFTLSDSGVYTKSGPESRLTIIPASATGDLKGITGEGRYFAEGETMVLELEVTL